MFQVQKNQALFSVFFKLNVDLERKFFKYQFLQFEVCLRSGN